MDMKNIQEMTSAEQISAIITQSNKRHDQIKKLEAALQKIRDMPSDFPHMNEAHKAARMWGIAYHALHKPEGLQSNDDDFPKTKRQNQEWGFNR